MNATKTNLLGMLRENTGASFLDSGSAYGRNHERNQTRNIESEPATTLKFSVRPYSGEPYLEIEVQHNTFHWLSERLDWDRDGNKALKACARFIRMSGGGELHNLQLMEVFPAFFAAWQARKNEDDRQDCETCESAGHHYEDDAETICRDCSGRGYIRTSSIRWNIKTESFDVTYPDTYEPAGIYGEGQPFTENTYNGEDLLDQTLQYHYFTINRTEYVVLQIHGGCDVRGGYTDPQVFTLKDMSILDNARATIYCSGKGESKQADLFPTRQENHYWTTDDATHWYAEGSCGLGAGKQLETYVPVIIDAEKFAELQQESEEDEDSPPIFTDRDGLEYVAEWLPGYLCVQEDKGFCPHCGGELKAGT